MRDTQTMSEAWLYRALGMVLGMLMVIMILVIYMVVQDIVAPCAITGDMNGDGIVNVLDVQMVVNAVLER